MTRDELNKLNSKIMKARLMGNEANAVELEKEYKKQVARFEAAPADMDLSQQVCQDGLFFL